MYVSSSSNTSSMGRRRVHPFFGDAATATEPRTGRVCTAEERRLRGIALPAEETLAQVEPQYLASPGARRLIDRGAYDAYRRMKAAAEADGLAPALLTIVSSFRPAGRQRQP